MAHSRFFRIISCLIKNPYSHDTSIISSVEISKIAPLLVIKQTASILNSFENFSALFPDRLTSRALPSHRRKDFMRKHILRPLKRVTLSGEIRTVKWWFFRRIRQEFYNPSRSYTLFALNLFVKLEKMVKGLFSNNLKNNSNPGMPLAVYDLRIAPVTFDFPGFLFLAELYFRKKGWDRFDVVIVDEHWEHVSDEYEQIISKENRRLRVYNMLFPMAQMYKACNSVRSVRSEGEVVNLCQNNPHVFPEGYTGIHVRYTKAFWYKESLSKPPYSGLQAPKHAIEIVQKYLAYKAIRAPFVSLTVRFYKSEPHRNTDLNIYFRLAEYLEKKGYIPIFIPDGENPYDLDFGRFHSYEQACWNLFLRMALYELCFTNISLGTGIYIMAGLNQKCSFIQGGVTNKDYPEEHLNSIGLKYGDQYFCGPDSRIEWGEPSYENFVKSFEIVKKVKNQSLQEIDMV